MRSSVVCQLGSKSNNGAEVTEVSAAQRRKGRLRSVITDIASPKIIVNFRSLYPQPTTLLSSPVWSIFQNSEIPLDDSTLHQVNIPECRHWLSF